MEAKLVRTAILAIGLMASSMVNAVPILWVGDSVGMLGTVDVADGNNVNVIGNMGVTMTDIAFDQSGNLYGISFSNLYSINTTTAAIADLGAHNIAATGNKNSLVFDASGTLYAANTSLYTLNTSTGASSLVGVAGSGYNSSGDLAFINNELYLSSSAPIADSLVKLDTVNGGAGTVIGSIGFNNVYGLATNNNTNLYGLSGTTVLSIDTISGLGTSLVNYSGHGLGVAWGSAFYTESGAVPAPPVLGIMALGLLGIGLSKKKKAT